MNTVNIGDDDDDNDDAVIYIDCHHLLFLCALKADGHFMIP